MEQDDMEKYPEGKLCADDEGEIRMAIYVHEGRIILVFEESVDWVGLPPAKAKELGEALIEAASSLLEMSN